MITKISKKILIPVISAFALVTLFFACKKDSSKPIAVSDRLTLKSETKVANVLLSITNTNVTSYLNSVSDLDFATATLSKVNEADSLEFYTIYYKNNLNKAVFIYHFLKSDRYVTMGIEHRSDEKKSTDDMIISDASGKVVNIENFKDQKSLGFASQKTVDELNLQMAPTKQRVMLVDPNGGGGETCYQCVNRNYQASNTKCSADFVCDIACSFNVSCKALFLLAATAVCTSGGSNPPCGIAV